MATMLSPEAERLAHELAAKIGASVEETIIKALQQQTEREERRIKFHEAIKEIQDRIAELPVLDDRSADEILGYDEWCLPR